MLLSVERPFVGASAFPIPGATLRHCTGLVPAVLPASTEHGKRKWGFPRNLGASYAAIRGSPSTRNSRPAYLEPRRCECRLDRLMVSRLLASPPAWEYEPGSFTASSLVTPGPRCLRRSGVRVVPV